MGHWTTWCVSPLQWYHKQPIGITEPCTQTAAGVAWVTTWLHDFSTEPPAVILYLVEIVRGQHGIGKYHLHPQYRKLVNTQPLPVENVYSPEQIVERIKGNLQETTTENTAHKPQKPPKALSQRERAKRLIEGKKFCFEPSLHTFTVIGSEEHPHAFSKGILFLSIHNPLLPHSGS